MITLYMIVLLSSILGSLLIWAEAGKQRLRARTLEEVLASLRPVQIEWVAVIALTSRERVEADEDLIVDDLWRMLGGWRGLSAMFANANSLYALAAIAHRRDDDEGDTLAELMRVQAVLLRSAAANALWRHVVGNRRHTYRRALSQVAVMYYDMTEALLASYEVDSRRAYARLCATLRPYLPPLYPY